MRVILAVCLSLCGPALAGTADEAPSAEAGAKVYGVFCKSCHGPGGRGDGDFADLLDAKPADLTRLSARNGGAFPRERVMRHIDGRDEVRGHGVIMPIFGPLFDLEVALQPMGTGKTVVTKRSVADLAAWIESIQHSE